MHFTLSENNRFIAFAPANDVEYEVVRKLATSEKTVFKNKRRQIIKRSYMNGTILPVGFWHKLGSLRRQHYVTFNGIERLVQNVSKEDINEWIDSIEFRNQKIKPRWYQREALYWQLKYRYSRGSFATGAGKTLICYLVCRKALEMYSDKILLVVPSTQLVKQTYDEWVHDYDSDGKVTIDVVSESYNTMRNSEGRVVISNIDTLRTFPESFFKQFDGIIFDEAHKLTTATYQKVIQYTLSNDLKFVYSVSGSWYEQNSADDILCEALSGPIAIHVSTADLIAEGSLTPVVIYEVPLKHSYEVSKQYYMHPDCQVTEFRNMRNHFELQYIREQSGRIDVICNTLNGFDNNQLLLFKSVAYCEQFASIIQQRTQKDVYIISGSVSSAEREQIKQITENNDNVVICATYGTMSTGINIKNLSTLHFVEPPKSFIWVRQSIGRTLRLHPSKTLARCISYVDIFKKHDATWGGPHSNIVANQLRHRVNTIYKKQQLQYKILDAIDIDDI